MRREVYFWGCVGLALLVSSLPMFAAEAAVLRNGFSIRHERREVIGSVTRLYTSSSDDTGFVDVATADIDHVEPDVSVSAPMPPVTSSAPKPLDLHEAIKAASGKHRLDPDLIGSVIRAESNFNQHAVSPKGARGLMQLMPTTASELGVKDAFDAGANVDGGTRYLRELLERYNFDLARALAAYNAGPKRVEYYRGVPPYHETRVYVANIIRDFNRKKLAERKAAAKAKAPAALPRTSTRAAAPVTTAELAR